MAKFLLPILFLVVFLSNQCQIGEYDDGGECKACQLGCSECTSLTVCTSCNANYNLYNDLCLKKNSSTITDCIKFTKNQTDESVICEECKYGTPMIANDRSQYCKCSQGYYKQQISNQGYECATLGSPVTLVLDDLKEQTLEQIAAIAQIVYGFQRVADSKEDYEANDANEIILLQALEFKIAAISDPINKNDMKLLIDILEIINCSTFEKSNDFIDRLKLIVEKIQFTDIEQFENLLTLAIEQQKFMTAENQKRIEDDAILVLLNQFITLKKDELDNAFTFSLSAGTLELSKMDGVKQFAGAILDYTDVLSEIQQPGDQIYAYVQQNEKYKTPKTGSTAKLLANPITINNYKLENGNAQIESFTQTLTNKFSICFNEMSQLENAVCMYWDTSKYRWSTEGIEMNEAKNCCLTTHFSTFGLIENGEQTIIIDNTNPGEYEEQLCNDIVKNCLECSSGNCEKCVGYTNPISGNCCQDGEKMVYYQNDTWECVVESTTGNGMYLPKDCTAIVEADLDVMKEAAFKQNSFQDLSFISSDIVSCSDFFIQAQYLPKVLEIVHGIIKKATEFDNTLMNDVINIATAVRNSDQANIDVIKSLIEAYGQILQRVKEDSIAYDIKSTDIQAYVIECMEKLLLLSQPSDIQPHIYHFSNFYVRIGQIIPTQAFSSVMYLKKYGIQFSSDLIAALNDGNNYYYINFIQEIVPYWDVNTVTQPEKLSFGQYFGFYTTDGSTVTKLDNSLFNHCGENAPIQFLSPGNNSIMVLQFWDNDNKNWKDKVVCTDINNTNAYCYPATYESQFFFVIGEDDTLGLNPDTCLLEDNPLCSSCNSEKECKTCYYGNVLIGDNYQYYGKCACPNGFYKAGWTTTDCTTTENLQVTWNQQVAKFNQTETLNNQSIIDLAFMVEELANETAYKDYMDNLVRLIKNTSLNSTNIEWILNVLNLFSQSIKENIEENYYEIFQMISNITSNNSIIMTKNLFKRIIEVGDKILFKLQNREYKKSFYSLVYSDIFLTMFKRNILPAFELEYELTTAENLTIGSTTVEITQQLIETIKSKATCNQYEIVMHEMAMNQNPYDLIQSAIIYSNVISLDIVCVTNSDAWAFEQLSLSSFFEIKFNSFTENDTQCVYWNSTNNSWQTDGTRDQTEKNKCEWNHLSTYAIMKINSNQIICDSRCKTCADQETCLTCESNDYLIENMCYQTSELTLDLVLKEDEIVYIKKILSGEDNKYLGINSNSELAYFEMSNTASYLYKQIQWRVNTFTESNGTKTYTFSNIYLEADNYKFNYSSIIKFLIQELDQVVYPSLYKNVGQLIPLGQTNCLVADNALALSDILCNQNNITQHWQFYPKKSTDHDPITISIESVGTDTLEIAYEHNNQQNISKAVFILDKQYPTNLYTLESIDCSSANTNSSFVTFQMKEDEVLIETTLSELLKCGFEVIESGDDSNLEGQIIVAFRDTEQIFYSPVTITFNSKMDVTDTVIKEASITSIKVQQGAATLLNTKYVAQVSLLNSGTSTETQALQVSDDFTMELSLTSDVQSTYEIAVVPDTGKLVSIKEEYDVALTLQAQTTKKNAYDIFVDIPDDVEEGQYRLKFTCTLTLVSNRILESLRFLAESQAGLIVDKSFEILKPNSNNDENSTNTSPNQNNTQIQDNAQIQEESDDSISVGIIVLLASSGVIAIALIFGIIYYICKIQSNKKKRENLSAKTVLSPENVEVDNLAECPNKI